MTTNIEKVRILIVGDSGVGKTCLTHLIATNECLIRPDWTVGCNIEVKLHEFKEGTIHQHPYFIEFYDIGGSLSHKNTRNVFYMPTHGIILVHDLTNRKSHANLIGWLYEILNKEGKDTLKAPTPTAQMSDGNLFDIEEFLGSTQIPILVIGTKLDLIDDKRRPRIVKKIGTIAEQCGAEEIWLNCHDPRSIAAGTTDAVKISRFFDRVIETRMYNGGSGSVGGGGGGGGGGVSGSNTISGGLNSNNPSYFMTTVSGADNRCRYNTLTKAAYSPEMMPQLQKLNYENYTQQNEPRICTPLLEEGSDLK